MRIIAFVNKGSGGNEGARVLEYLKNELGDENVFDIKADKGPARGLDARASDPSFEVRIIVAGGDGTFSWVADAVDKRNLKHVRLIVIPLGSGNDMSRALGWGRKFPGMNNLKMYLDSMQTARAHKLDVWRLSAVESQTANAAVDDDGIAHGARPLMCNYLSLGADAFVELRFNQLRWENPDKYKSRLGNFKAHALVGAKYMFSPKTKIHVADHIDTLIVDDKPIPIPKKLQALIFLNIPSYGAGTQPWGSLGSIGTSDIDKSRKVRDMYVDDHEFEVIGLKSLSQFGMIKLFGAHGVRVAQGKRMQLTLKTESTPFQVDGEPWEQRGGTVTMEPGNRVGVLEGPVWSGSSKKNAKFAPNDMEEMEADEYGDDREDAVVQDEARHTVVAQPVPEGKS